MVTKHLFLSGKVQGVSFRFFAHEKAREIGVRGWVRNLEDGRVEVVVAGDTDKVEGFVAWLRQGPPHAQVQNVEIQNVEKSVEESVFYIRRDSGPTWQK